MGPGILYSVLLGLGVGGCVAAWREIDVLCVAACRAADAMRRAWGHASRRARRESDILHVVQYRMMRAM